MTIMAILGWIAALLLAFRIKRMERSHEERLKKLRLWAEQGHSASNRMILTLADELAAAMTERDQLRARLREGEA